ncbi:MAG: hypothetical protein GXP31_01795 [Kiritimatiellaeota bacterium]|nr:hypothetical protein [Kiritimatiellota bacterium]
MHSKARWIGIATILLVLSMVFIRCRGGRLNSWRLVNAPPGPGPIVCFGDSLVAGVGAGTAEESYPARLGVLLGRPVEAYGYPGFTAEQGRRKLEETPALGGSVVVVTLGGNDILRKVPVETTCRHLEWIFTELQRRGAVVVFTEVLGLFSDRRSRRYRELCRRRGVAVVPDVLKGILTSPGLKADTIHPNGAGYRIMAEKVARTVRELGLVPEAVR